MLIHCVPCMGVQQNGLTFNADLAATAFLQEQPLIDYILTVLRMRDIRSIASRGFNSDQVRTVEKALKLKGVCTTTSTIMYTEAVCLSKL
jgi:hypothetical protein